MEQNVIKMIIPCECPSCGAPVIVNLDMPHPTAEVITPDEAPEDIKQMIETNNDSTEEPEAA